MTWPLRLQILLPAACLLIVAVCINAVAAAIWASHRSEQQITERLHQVGQVLADTSFPRSPQVLAQLRQLTNSEYAVWDLPRRELLVTTFEQPERAELATLLQQAEFRSSDLPRIRISLNSREYRATRIEPTRTQGREELWLLVPEAIVSAERWSAAWPALIVGSVSLLLLIPIVTHVARRLGQRIATLQHQVTAVADGHYELLIDAADVDDEIHHLVDAVNEMTRRLRELERRIAHTERTRLLGQFAGGVVHQLRNSIAGARLAVQLHSRRCAHVVSDDSLSVALKQLSLTEQHLKGILALGRQTPVNRVDCDPGALTQQVVELISPMAEHLGAELTQSVPSRTITLPIDREAMISAILNLVMNGLEAAGHGGQVCLELSLQEASRTVTWTVRDSGPGPSADLAERMFEPFQTTKPEGVGLGLAQALQVANDHAGTLDWVRDGNWTVFRLQLPLPAPSPRNPPP